MISGSLPHDGPADESAHRRSPDGADGLRLSVLGSLRIERGGREVPAGPRQQRLILALLLGRAGKLVETPEFVRLLWEDHPPPTANNMIQRYVGGLRRILEPALPSRSPGRLLRSDPGGYRLVLPDRTTDLLEFRTAVTAARRASAEGAEHDALELVLAGLELWRGRFAAGLGAVAETCPVFVAIERERVEAVRTAVDLALRCGRPSRVLPVLTEAVSRDPLDEALQRGLMTVLAADGRTAEAVARYGRLRRCLADELGLEPGPETQSAFRAILRTGDSYRETPPVAAADRPAQLPPDLRSFVGRARELRTAAAVLTESGPAVAVAAFDGAAGVGKSALAVHLGHRLQARFPSGQLYADLRGPDDGGPVDPSDVLGRFLLALGVDPRLVPADLARRAALYRGVTARRRLLVVLDDAATSDQVRPLLPGAGGVVVTSRQRLTGLSTVPGIWLHSVTALPAAEARSSSKRRIGDTRASVELRDRRGLPETLTEEAADAGLAQPRCGRTCGQPTSVRH